MQKITIAEFSVPRILLFRGTVLVIAIICWAFVFDSPNYQGGRFSREQGLILLFFACGVFTLVAAHGIWVFAKSLSDPVAVYAKDKILFYFDKTYKSVEFEKILSVEARGTKVFIDTNSGKRIIDTRLLNRRPEQLRNIILGHLDIHPTRA